MSIEILAESDGSGNTTERGSLQQANQISISSAAASSSISSLIIAPSVIRSSLKEGGVTPCLNYAQDKSGGGLLSREKKVEKHFGKSPAETVSESSQNQMADCINPGKNMSQKLSTDFFGTTHPVIARVMRRSGLSPLYAVP